MTNDPGFPTIDQQLPEMMEFASGLANDFRSGGLKSWQDLMRRVHAFFSAGMLDKVESVAPGWREMSGHANGVTLVHVMCAFTGLLNCPEFKRATRAQQEMTKWTVLFHDIAKQVHDGHADRIHAFRSAARAGAALPGIGFAVTAEHGKLCDAWYALVDAAIVSQGEAVDPIQDNRKLPEILDGIERLYGSDSPAAFIVKTVLLHMSINILAEYPAQAALTDAESAQYLDRELLELLKLLSLADSDGWELFRSPTRERYRQQTLAVFEDLECACAT
jgi:hypothetical protein